MRTLSTLGELPFEFSVGIHGGLESHPGLLVDDGVWVVFPDAKNVVDIAAVVGEIVLKERDNFQLPNTKVKGSIDAAWGCSHGSTSRLEPVSIAELEVVAAHNYLEGADEWFSTDRGSEWGSAEEGRDS